MSKQDVLSLLNEKLSDNNIQLLEENILKEWVTVEGYFNKRLEKYTSIKIVLLGEATVNAKNYLLNQDSVITTSFLEPNHFGQETKQELNQFLIENGILPFDLYAVPLPTFIYDNIKFKFNDEKTDKLYIEHLHKHFFTLKQKIVPNQVKLIMRYTKLKKRREWKLFKEYFADSFGNLDSNILDISKNIRASEDKIKKHFGHLINDAHNRH